MKHTKSMMIAAILFTSAGLFAQTPRTFRSQEIVLDNGSGATDTVQFTGASNQMLDVSGLATANGNLTLNTNLDMNNKNLLNGGTGVFAGLTNTGALTVRYAIPGFTVPGFLSYTVGTNDYFIESIFTTDIYLPSSSSYPGRVLKIANMNTIPLIIHFAAGDHTVSTPPVYSFSLTLNSGACVTLISDGGFSGWVQAGH